MVDGEVLVDYWPDESVVDHLNHDELWPCRIFIYEMHQLLLQR